MSHLPDLMQQATESIGLATSGTEKDTRRTTTSDIASVSTDNAGSGFALWRDATEALTMPTQNLITAISDGLEHAGLQLGIIHRRLEPGHDDAESRGGVQQPGDSTFSAYLEEKLNEFSRGRLQSLSAWTVDTNISQEQEPGFLPKNGGFADHDAGATETAANYRQLNLILYIHQMVSQTSLIPLNYANGTCRSSTRLVWLCLSYANSQTAWCHKA